MTVKDTEMKSSSTSKKKTSASSKTSTKTSKVVGSTSTTEAGALSKSSSSSSLQISDVSHLPVQTNVVTYVVTEALPTGSGEKITTYTETGATATEYRHFIEQDSSTQHSTGIQQIASDLNQSISNLSQASGSTYTVTEPMEELKLTYNINDSAWNGKFVQEKFPQGKTVVEQTSSSHQQSSSTAKTSSSSYAVEIVDGKERIIDQQHHETSHATQSSNEERLDMKSGTDVTPEVHYKQKATESSTRMDSAVPELQQPKTKSSEAVREIHQVGDEVVTSTKVIKDKAKNVSTKHGISNKTKQVDAIKTSSIDKASKQKSKVLGGKSTHTTTTTYYDSQGNVVKTSTDVDTQNIPSSEIVTESSDTRKSEVIKDNTIETTDISTNEKSTSSPDRQGKSRSKSPSKKPQPVAQKLDDTTQYIDENYVNTSKIRNAQTSSDSSNFYGHNVDSSATVVENIYDSNAIQNTIGYKGRVVMDQNIDDKNVVYSNDRNYGKTGWNGQFTYEKPQKVSPPRQTTTEDFISKETEENIKQFAEDEAARKSSSTVYTEGPTTIEYFKIVDGKEIPVGKKVIPGSTTETSEKSVTSSDQRYDYDASNIAERCTITDGDNKSPGFPDSTTVESVSKVYDTKTTIIKDGQTFSDSQFSQDHYTIVDGKKIPSGELSAAGAPTKKYPQFPEADSTTVVETLESVSNVFDSKSKRISHPEDLPAAGVPSRKPKGPEAPIKKGKSRPEDLPSAGKPAIDSTTVETVSKTFDSKTTVIRDSETFVDNQSTEEHYTIIDGEKIPLAPEDIKPIADTEPTNKFPVESTTIVESFETISNIFDTKKPSKKHPEDLPAAGVPSRKPKGPGEEKPKKRQESPSKKGKLRPEDLPSAGKPSKPQGTRSSPSKEPAFPGIDSKTTVSETFDSKTTVVKDSETFVDKQSTEEHYTIIDGEKVPIEDTKFPRELPAAGVPSRKPKQPQPGKLHPEDYPAAGKPSTADDYSLSPFKKGPDFPDVESTTVVETFETISNVFDSKSKVIKDSQTFVDKKSTEEQYTIVDGQKIPSRPTEDTKKPSKKHPEDLPAAGMPSRKPKGPDEEKPKQRSESPVKKGKLHPEDLPSAGKPTKPLDTTSSPSKEPVFPETTVSKTFDSTTTVVKDSETFVDKQSTEEHYTIIDGEKIPLGPTDRKPIEDTKFPKELPTAGLQSRQIVKPRPAAGKPSTTDDDSLSPFKKGPDFPDTESTTIVETFETVSKVLDNKCKVIQDTQAFVDKESTEEFYTTIDGQKIPSQKPSKKHPEDLPAAGMPSRKPKGPDEDKPKKRPESPSKKGKIHPEDLPSAGKPSKPKDKSLSPPPDSKTTVESVETVSRKHDSKTTIVKGSQTFVDNQSTEEHYTIVDGEKIPLSPKDRKPIEDTKPYKKFPEELPAAGMPSRKPENQLVKPRPAAGKPSTTDDYSLSPFKKGPDFPDVESTTTETVSKVFDNKSKIIKDTQTFVDKESTEEYYTIIDGQKIPSKPTEDDKKPSKKHPEDLPAAGMPSRKPKGPDEDKPKKRPESPSKKGKIHPEDLPSAGKPSKPKDKSSSPSPDSKTTIESVETVSKKHDSKTTIVKGSQTFVDNQTTEEHYTIVDGVKIPLGPDDKKPIEDTKPNKKFPEELPAAGMPSRKPKGPDEDKPKKRPDSPSKKGKIHPEDLPSAGKPSKPKDKSSSPSPDSKTTIESVETVSKKHDTKTTVVKGSETFVDNQTTEEHYTIIDGKKIPLGPKDRKPIEDTKPFPEELPAAGKPSRKPENQVVKSRPAAGQPSTTDDDSLSPFKKGPDFPDMESTTVVETFETVSKVFDSKSKVIKDTQTFVDKESTEEYYTIVDGQKIPKKPEDSPAAGMPSRKPKGPDEEKPKQRPESPSKKGKLHPEDLPSAGKPTKPQDKTLLPFTKKPEFPEIDSTTTVESFETVSKVFDSKTTVIKDSQTFVDNQSTLEHYTIVNGERIPLGPTDKKPIEELPAAGVPSRKPKKPEEKAPKKRPKSPSRKEKLHPEDFPAAGLPSRKPESPDDTIVENYEITDQVVDIKEGITENFSSKTVVDKYVTNVTDITDRVDKTFITEDITDIKDINQVENITNVKKITDNKVIKIERVIKEPEPSGPHYVVPMKEQCICELCICGTSTHIE